MDISVLSKDIEDKKEIKKEIKKDESKKDDSDLKK